MKILIVTGSYPPDICGVGDYSHMLFNHLSIAGCDIEIVKISDWSLFGISRIYKTINKICPDIVHIQYPTEGYGYSIVPQLLCIILKQKVVITLHEFSSKSLFGKIAIYIFLLFGNKIIFTTEYELAYAKAIAPFVVNKALVINIGSNIPIQKECLAKIYDVVYFGHIRPNKGIEEFVELIKLDSSKELKFLIIGQMVRNYELFYENLIHQLNNYINVEIKLNLSSDDVAYYLSISKYAYLPYPDGASRRRGTLLAALGNRCIVISKLGKFVDNELSKVCLFAVDYRAAAEFILNRITIDSKILFKFSSKFDWLNVALQHKELYNKL